MVEPQILILSLNNIIKINLIYYIINGNINNNNKIYYSCLYEWTKYSKTFYLEL